MLVLGSLAKIGVANILNETSCKPQYPPVRVLDTFTYVWKNGFDPLATYSVPFVVTDVVGGKYVTKDITGLEGGFNYTTHSNQQVCPIGHHISNTVRYVLILVHSVPILSSPYHLSSLQA